jgi:hypothetical protein
MLKRRANLIRLPGKDIQCETNSFPLPYPLFPQCKRRVCFLSRPESIGHNGCWVRYADGVVYSILVLENPKPRESLEDFVATNSYGLDLAAGQNLIRDGFAGKEFSSPSSVSQFFATEDRLYKFHAISMAENDPSRTR